MRLIFFITVLLLSGCGDNLQYNKEHYVSFESIDELVVQIIENIKKKNVEGFLHLIDNDALILDLLLQSNDQNAKKTSAFFNSKEGRRTYNIKRVNKKERIRVFLDKGLDNQLTLNVKAFKSTGIELVSAHNYASDLPAKIQKYRIRLDNGDRQQYAYDIEVLYCRAN